MNHIHKHKQSGVTLLMAVLMVATLSIIAITIAFLAVQDIRSSRAVFYTEPAIGAAQSGAENAIWTIKRSRGTLNNCPSTSSPSVGVSSGLSVYCKSYGTASFTLAAGTPYTFYLYDPKDINGDYDLKGCISCTPASTNPAGFPITSMTVTNRSTIYSVQVYLTRLNGTPLASQPVNVIPGATQTFNNLAGPVGADNRMKVVLQSSGNVLVDVNTDQGMPDFPTIDSTGCSGHNLPNSNCSGTDLYNRRLNVTVPQ